MEKVALSELRNHLSAYIKKVRAGEVVVVWDRNRPVARLERVADEEEPDDRLAKLEEDGLLLRASRPVPIDILKSVPPKSSESVLAALLEERQQGR